MRFALQQLWRRIRGVSRGATFSASITPTPNQYDVLNIGTLTGPITIANPSGTFTDGQQFVMRITQDAIGSRVVTWGTAYEFNADVVKEDFSTAANAKYEVTFRYHAGTGKWRAVSQARGF